MATAAEFLVRAQNPDGGWGYRVRGMSFVEPTSCVLLALSTLSSSADTALQPSRDRALAWLTSLQHTDGGWGVGAVDRDSGWMTAWAVYALARLQPTGAALERGVKWLLKTQCLTVMGERERADAQAVYHIDASLPGFPWHIGDAAWVHPTAVSLIALCAAGHAESDQSRQAVAFLLDRAVESGGWNFGNPQIMRMPMSADVQDTAITLLALRFSKAQSDVRIDRGLSFLTRASQSANSTSVLAWSTYLLREFNLDSSHSRARLTSKQDEDGSWNANPLLTAVAVLAGADKGYAV